MLPCVRVHMYVCTFYVPACKGSRLTFGVLFDSFPLYTLGQGLSIELELTDVTSLSSQLAPAFTDSAEHWNYRWSYKSLGWVLGIQTLIFMLVRQELPPQGHLSSPGVLSQWDYTSSNFYMSFHSTLSIQPWACCCCCCCLQMRKHAQRSSVTFSSSQSISKSLKTLT